MYRSNYYSTTNTAPADLMTAQEIAIKAHESAEIDPLERDQVILTCAETALLLNSTEAAFNLLKLVKASNLDCQVMFIEILLRLGQVGMARGRLEKMKNIPEWKDDVRFLLTRRKSVWISILPIMTILVSSLQRFPLLLPRINPNSRSNSSFYYYFRRLLIFFSVNSRKLRILSCKLAKKSKWSNCKGKHCSSIRLVELSSHIRFIIKVS